LTNTTIRCETPIDIVVKHSLCTGCGICVAVCPTSTLQMVKNEKEGIFIPVPGNNRCNQCGICYEVCPGHHVDFDQLNIDIFGKKPVDVIIGNYLQCYTGHAEDHEIRYNASSGGLVTALLLYALDEGTTLYSRNHS
jgi:coenzyme F420 hydrogenase subunit beta